MNPTQAHPGHYWRSNDPADLAFNEAGAEQPQIIHCFNMRDHLNRGATHEVPVGQLEFLAAGSFGEARPCGFDSRTKWTGDSHRYGIYRNPMGLYKNGIVMLECHGGGMVGYAFDNSVAGETWEYIAVTFPPEMIWNLCNLIAHAYGAARDAERSRVYRAFLEGRMKKRRKHHKICVDIIPASSLQATA